MNEGVPVNISHMSFAAGPDETHGNNRVPFYVIIFEHFLVQIVQVNQTTGFVVLGRDKLMLHDEPFGEAISIDTRKIPPSFWWSIQASTRTFEIASLRR